MGRPLKIDAERIAAITSAIRMGNYIVTACKAGGISKELYYNGLERGRELIDEHQLSQYDIEDICASYEDVTKRPIIYEQFGLNDKEITYVYFHYVMTRAEAESEIKHVKNIDEHSHKNWQASAWLLERKNPERWSLRTNVDINIATGMKIRTRITDVLNDQSDTNIIGVCDDALALAMPENVNIVCDAEAGQKNTPAGD